MYNQAEICKARSLFITRGMLKREIIPDEIVYSWVRSKLHNISYEILNIEKKNENLNLLSLDKEATQAITFLRRIHHQLSRLYLIDFDGSVLFETSENSLNLPLFTSFKEEAIGTSAAGISLVLGENSTVYGCEHYNKALINYISESIVINKEKKPYIIQIITPIRQYTSHQRIIKQIIDKYSKEVEQKPLLTENQSQNDPNSSVNPINKGENTDNFDKTKTPSNTDKTNECKQFTLSVIERQTIQACLKHFEWNLKRSSEALGIGRSTLYRKIKEYDIKRG